MVLLVRDPAGCQLDSFGHTGGYVEGRVYMVKKEPLVFHVVAIYS